MKSLLQITLAIVVFSLSCAGSALASGETVTAAIGTLPPGKSIVITYDVTVNANLPADRTSVSQQGTVSGGNFTSAVTDDPDTGTPNDPTVTVVYANFTGKVTGIVVDAAAPLKLYAGIDGEGVHRSTDGGATWLPATVPADMRIMALVINPLNHATLFAASYGAGVYTSSDSGDNWAPCANTGLSGGALNAVSLAIDSSAKLYIGTEAGIFTSTDCSSWSAVNSGLTVDAAKPTVAIVIDPTNPANLFAGLDGVGVFRSTTGGASWSQATTQPTSNRVKALVLKPGDATKLYTATYGGGVFKSTDSGATWSVCANTNLTNLNLVSLTVDASGRLFAGTEAGVFVSTDGCASWTALNGGLP